MSEDGKKTKIKVGIIADDTPFDFSDFTGEAENDKPFTCEFCKVHYKKGRVYFMQRPKDKKVAIACSKCAKQRRNDLRG